MKKVIHAQIPLNKECDYFAFPLEVIDEFEKRLRDALPEDYTLVVTPFKVDTLVEEQRDDM